MPPSTLIGSGQGRWSEKDRLIAVALHLYEKGLCSCGAPLSEWDTEQDYVPTTYHCPKCAAQERHRRENEQPEPGEKTVFVKETEGVDFDDVPPVFADD